MADTAMQFLLDNLSQLIKEHVSLIAGAAEQVKQLMGDLKYLNAVLEYASKKRIVDETKLVFISKIRDIVYEAEDVVDDFFTQTLMKRAQNRVRRFTSGTVKLDGIAQRVNALRAQVEDGYGDHGAIENMLKEIGDDPNDKIEVAKVREKNVVGLEKETEEIVGILNHDTQLIDVISIIGMPGLGKSTLAGKIFRDPTVQYEFPTRIWVNVSKFPIKDVFLSMLREFTAVDEDTRSMREHELAAKVKRHLETGKFFIVMDDVWTSEDWEKVSLALPDANYQLKVLITSRNEPVARKANPKRPPYNLKLLNSENSVKLLQYEVFGEASWDPDFEEAGKSIAGKCKGLPLAIVVTGGIIRDKLPPVTEHAARVSAWEEFAEKVPEYLVNDHLRTMEKVISLSYEKLPYHMKACFLYFGMFPEDMKIPARKLFQMWIAEGFIPENANFTLEQVAEIYLDDLINRNLIMIDKRRSNGKVKTCYIHDSLRDFCKSQASKDGFLEEIVRRSGRGNFEPVLNDSTNYRRLCVHSYVSDFLASKLHGRKVRTFVCLCEDDFNLDATHVSAIPSGFKMLRVLDVKPVRFPKISSSMFELLHLRYIHLYFNSNILPQKFSDFPNLQTLIVDTPESTLEIKADIWKMRNLRHVKTSATARLPQPANAAAQDESSNIQTLGTISPEDCTKKVLGRAGNLRRVSIRGELGTLLKSSTTEGSFDNIAELGNLEQLKLENSVPNKPSAEVRLPRLPSSEKFPTRLKILTLKYTYLDWSQMQILGSLYHLEVLNLKERAFTGNNWVTDDGGFKRLRVLFIGRTNLATWKVSAGIFPCLVHLELDNCDDLRNVPIEFAHKRSLRVLTLNNCRMAASSTAEIKKLKPENFQVNVFPPIN